MEEEVGKWRVRYSRQVKQKRKRFQEGRLILLSNNKVMVYDDESWKLVDSKFLNQQEALNLKPGASFTFSSCLVHIDHPLPSSDNPNTTSARNNLSPSLHFIREFKKNQVIKYTTHHTPSNPTPSSSSSSSLQEWEALYTTHITQKSKTYHDGFIHLLLSGSHSKQVLLYDSSKTQIDKTFLNKDQVICSGESLKFDAHLVEIGDALANTTNNSDVKNEASNYNTDQVKSGRKWHKLSNDHLVHNQQRCNEPTKQNHLTTANEKLQNYAGSNMCHGSSFGGPKTVTMNPTKTPHSLVPPRDVHHILSILKKPAAQDNVPIREKAAVKQFLSQSSEVVQFVIDDGTASSNKLQASDNHRQSIIDHPIQLAGVMGSISPGSQETRSTHQQPCAKLPETDASSVERISSTSVKPKARRLFSELNGMKIKKNNVNSDFSLGPLDCPSFDLGI